MDMLLLRFDAPLMSFGGVTVDSHGVIQPFPSMSMICGLLGNALGYHHADTQGLQRLQERLQYACRQDRRGSRMRDFQTVDLGQEHMDDKNAWTTWGQLQERKGGTASSGTLIRERDYWADARYTISLMLEPVEEIPTLTELQHALAFPERPLFIGRKPCMPADMILLGRTEAQSLLAVLSDPDWAPEPGTFQCCWPATPRHRGDHTKERPVSDARDWANQIHVGERWIVTGTVSVPAKEGSNAQSHL